jgi:hypothetical protein
MPKLSGIEKFFIEGREGIIASADRTVIKKLQQESGKIYNIESFQSILINYLKLVWI